MTKLTPFTDDAGSVSIGKLTVENGTDQVTIYGSLDITRDKQGLAHAQALKALLHQIVQLLGADNALPDAVEAAVPAKTVRNPFT